MYTIVYGMSGVVPARLPLDLVRGIDGLVKSGRYANRSEVIKEAARLLVSSGGLPPSSALGETAARLVSALVAWDLLGIESVTLYGSVARREAGSQSDIDILVVVDKGEPWKTRRSLYDLIYPVIAALGVDISLMVVSRDNWLDMLESGDPFALNVLKEGRPLWGQLTRPA
jgi:predicted nucleotidyltransferase